MRGTHKPVNILNSNSHQSTVFKSVCFLALSSSTLGRSNTFCGRNLLQRLVHLPVLSTSQLCLEKGTYMLHSFTLQEDNVTITVPVIMTSRVDFLQGIREEWRPNVWMWFLVLVAGGLSLAWCIVYTPELRPHDEMVGFLIRITARMK